MTIKIHPLANDLAEVVATGEAVAAGLAAVYARDIYVAISAKEMLPRLAALLGPLLTGPLGELLKALGK